jgi:redox-sensing transcriptional repressor
VAGKEIVVSDISKLPQVVLSSGASIGVIATPEAAAQDVCDLMVRNGITSVLNFAPVLIEVPEGVDVRRVDLATELQILAFHEQRKSQSALTQANAG